MKQEQKEQHLDQSGGNTTQSVPLAQSDIQNNGIE